MSFNSDQRLEAFGLPRSFASSKHMKNKFHNYQRKPIKPKEYSTEAHDHFNKKYQLTNNELRYELPDGDGLFTQAKWQLERFQALKQKLNEVKSNLNDVHLKTWHQHTNFVNRSSKVVQSVKRLIRPQLGTQAWCKFHEIINAYELVPVQGKCFTSVHLCEAPGAFITSLNHYLKLHHPHIQWDWIANTLNPHHESNSFDEMISDDRLILGTSSKWYFGPDHSGNIMVPEFVPHCVQHVQYTVSSPVLLVTADGSFNCQGNPGEQEILVGKLHYREVQTALSLLQSGGNFLLKLFTMFESDTISLVYLLSCLFNSIDFYKPGSSKEGNSEVYVICRGFRKESVGECLDLNKAFDPVCQDRVILGRGDIPDEFLDKLYQGVLLFTEYQISAIERNITLFKQDIKSNPLDCARLDKLQTDIQELYLHNCRLKPIPDCDLIMSNTKNTLKQILTFDGRIENGAYKERLAKENLTLDQYIVEELSHIDVRCEDKPEMRCIDDLHRINFKEHIHLVKGKTLHSLQSSIFCLARLFKLLYEIRRERTDTNEIVTETEEQRKQRFLSRLISLNLPHNSTDTLILDLSSHCHLTHPNVYLSQLELLQLLIQTLATLPSQHSILLINIPLLTQFTVSTLVLLTGRLFEKVWFLLLHDSSSPSHSSHGILLHSLQRKDTEGILQHVADEYRTSLESSQNKECVLSVLPVTMLCEHPLLYKYVFEINCCVLKNHILSLIQSESPPET
uniref:Cap-specific mRNA (nucleoside-2'-O-)-methyltransferase 2 n=1 Tax=Cacopsylla melanoneura TaxID=428564 RepID=A0A8D8Q5Y6_9HEMI